MKPKVVLALFLVALNFNCKNEKSLDKLKVVEHTIEKSKVYLELDMVVRKNDTFQIYYTEDGTPNCSEDNSVKVEVKGNDLSQKIVFEMPEDIKANYIRIDIGINPNQEAIKVNNLSYKYFDKVLDISGDLFFKHYLPNKFFKIDHQNSLLIPTEIKEGYDPILWCLKSTISEFNKLIIQ